MSEEEQGVTLPVEWHVPEGLQSHYANHLIVQPGQNEIILFFFETQIPPFGGPTEANREYLLKQGSVRFECVGKMIVAPQMVPEIIQALQTGLNSYTTGKMNEERERPGYE